MTAITTKQATRKTIAENYYAILPASELSIPAELEAAKKAIFADFDDLPQDNYMKDNASYRQRRLGYYYMLPAKGELLPIRRSHYIQSEEINSYVGGVAREFGPLTEETYANPFLHALIWFSFNLFPIEEKYLNDPWEIDYHPVRIIANTTEAGEPTPEGIHQDDVDFFSLHLAKRSNAKGGVSGMYDLDKKLIEKATLIHPMDTAFGWDPHLMHDVTPITPDDPSKPAIRDMLLIGYTRKPELKRPER